MKHKMWSRLLSMALAVMMIVSIVPNSAFAEAANEITSTSQVQEIPAEETQTPEEVTVPEAETPAEPSTEPAPTEEPVAEPTAEPTVEPTAEPTQAPAESAVPSDQPSAEPTAAPEAPETPNASAQPSETPAASATPAPSESPVPSETPEPTETPEVTEEPVVLNEKEYTVSAETSDGVKVEVTVPAETLPEGAELKVDRLAEGSEDYNAAQKTLEENGVEFDGFAALDIRFEMNGEEVEPVQPVQVKIIANNVLPEEVDPATVAVQHLKENEDGTVTVENVAVAETVDENTVQADMPAMIVAVPAEEQAGEAQPAEEPGIVTADGSALIAEFTVDRFSHFTVTWEGWRTNRITVQYVDKNDVNHEVDVPDAPTGNIDADKGKLESLDTYKEYATNAGYEVTDVQVYNDSGCRQARNVSSIQYKDEKLQYRASGEWKRFSDGDVLKILCYKPVEYTPVDTVDSYGEGVKLYMVDFASEWTAGEMGVKTEYGNGSRKTGLVKNELGADGFPVSQTNKSLSQWFDPSKNADMIAANNLFLQSEYDNSGYFYYSGSDNFATIMEGESYQHKSDGATLKDFTVYNQLASPSSDTSQFYFRRGNFLPFNTLSDEGKIANRNLYDYLGNALEYGDPRYNEPLYSVDENDVDFYFGMYMAADFVYPKNGQVNNQDMVFEFTGDDDMWVFIDGKLVLDLGGRHDALTGTINFATGEVVEYNSAKPGQQANTTESKLWDKLDITEDQYFSKDFAAYTKHTIKMFYMESGAGASNLRIKFNLPTIPDNSLDVTKNLQKTNNDALDEYLQKTMTYRFQVLNTDGTSRIKTGDKYEIYENNIQVSTGTVGENDIFTLKAGQTARFIGQFPADSSPYVVKELIPDGASGQYEGIIYEVSGKGETATIESETGEIGDIKFNGYSTEPISPADGSATIVYTNQVTTEAEKWSMLKITKELTNGQQPVPGDVFQMYVTLNGEPLAVGTQYTVTGQADPKTVKEKGMIELQAGESATLPVLADVTFKVTEQKLSNAYGFVKYEYSDADAEEPVDKVETDQGKGISGYVNTAGNFEVTVTNSRNYGDVTITKTIKNDANLTDQQLEKIKSKLTFTLKKGADTEDTVSGTKLSWQTDGAGNLVGTYTFYNKEEGDYTVTESVGDSTPANVILNVKIDGVKTQIVNGGYTSGSGKLTVPGSVKFAFDNIYELGNGTLQINKKLIDKDGNDFAGYGKGKDVFSFQIKADTGIDKGKVWYMQVDGDGAAYYSEENGQKLTSLTLPSGEYTVTELDNINYTFTSVSALKNGVNEGEADNKNHSITVTVSGNETTQVTFTNRANNPGMTDGSGVINKFVEKDGKITFEKIWIANDDDEQSLLQQDGNQ